ILPLPGTSTFEVSISPNVGFGYFLSNTQYSYYLPPWPDATTAITLTFTDSVGTKMDVDITVRSPDTVDTTLFDQGLALSNIFGTGAPTGMRLQADGKIVVSGYLLSGTTQTFAVARFNSDGAVDTTFGVAGLAQQQITATSTDEKAMSVALQPDGKIIAAGY